MTDWQRWTVFVVLAAVLVVATVIDWRTGKIPNWLTVPAMLFGLLFWLVSGLIVDGVGAAMKFGTDAGFAWLLALVGFTLIKVTTGGLGFGDVKLMAAAGAISGRWEIVVSAAFYGLIAGALLGLVLMVKHGQTKATFGRLFGAMLMAGGKVKADLDHPDSVKVPYAFGIMIGSLLGAAEVLLGLDTPWAGFGMI